MSELSESQRKIIKMSFWENKSLSEQANILGVTRQCVHITKQRALNNLATSILSMFQNQSRSILKSSEDILA